MTSKLTKHSQETTILQVQLQDDLLCEINRLEVIIPEALAELTKLESQLHYITEQKSRFLNEYYEKITPIVDMLKSIDKEIAYENNDDLAEQDIENFDICDIKFSNNTDIDHEIKAIYRKLVRLCHPDTGNKYNSGDIFNAVNDAYQNKDLIELIRLDRTLSENNENYNDFETITQLQTLSLEYDQILERIRLAKLAIEQETTGPEYKLVQRIIDYNLYGLNFIDELKESLFIELNKREAELYRKKR